MSVTRYTLIISVLIIPILLLTGFLRHPEDVNPITDRRPPNIIFILTDDQRWDALGYAGNKIIHTPHLDQLARKGYILKMPLSPLRSVQRAGQVCSRDFMKGHMTTHLGSSHYPISI